MTTGDFASEKYLLETLDSDVIREMLGENPAFYSEEAGGSEYAGTGYRWIIDPVDGTRMYALQDSRYGISIGLEYARKSVLGVIALPSPAHQIILSATADMRTRVKSFRGEITTARVSARESIADCFIWTDWTHGTNHCATIQIFEKLNAVLKQRSMLSGSFTYAAAKIAMGHIDGFVVPFPGPNIEDHAAAGLIIQQAGGTVTDLAGNPWTLYSTSFVASNGLIHDNLLKILRKR